MALPFAAFDSCAIYAIGDTPALAVSNARNAANEPYAEFATAPINRGLAEQIVADGWNGNRQTFEIRDGIIIETTDE